MDYIEYHLKYDKSQGDYVTDLLSDYLLEFGFDSFSDAEDGLLAYRPAPELDVNEFKNALDSFEYAENITFETQYIKGQNWNQTWEQESNVPQYFDGKCVVHSPAYADVQPMQYDILIDPKLSFGSGHHETTTLMIRRMLQTSFAGKSVCDMGCGTAVLAILSHMMGAKQVVAIDIDQWAYENAKVNLHLNSISDIDVRLGGYDVLPETEFDFFLANINRNILLEGIPFYAKSMKKGGFLYLSGFYNDDIPVVDAVANDSGLQRVGETLELNGWVSVSYVKE